MSKTVKMSAIQIDKINQFKSIISGRVVLTDDADYDEIRAIWNAMIDRQPAVIVQCSNSSDVLQALAFAKENKMELSVRGGGHNIAGSSMNDNGLVIDFSRMKNVRVDPEKKRAFVEPGAILGDLDEATQKHGLATPVGINSTTGVAGLTLGGGFGWMTRQYGLTIDNLISVDIITANGKMLKADKDENSDLFWAIRGGGGNFGIVTQFEFALHPVGPEILAGFIFYPLAQAEKVLSQYKEFAETAPEELNVWVISRYAPPLPFLPENSHGTPVVLFAICYTGDIATGEKLIQPLRSFGEPLGIHLAPQPYKDWQKAFDPLLVPGARNYWKSHNLIKIDDGLIDKMIEYTENMPSKQCEIFVAHIKGASNLVSENEMAYGHRDVNFILNVHGRWDSSENDDSCVTWARDFFKASKPYASAGAYVNFMTEEESDRVESVYGSNYDRLTKLKSKYDPDNIFHINQNIKP